MNKLKSILALFIFTFSLNINDVKVLDAMDNNSKIDLSNHNISIIGRNFNRTGI